MIGTAKKNQFASHRQNPRKEELGNEPQALLSGSSEQTFDPWKKQFTGLEIDQVRQLKQRQDEKGRRRKLVAELTLDRAMLPEVLRPPAVAQRFRTCAAGTKCASSVPAQWCRCRERRTGTRAFAIR